MTRFAPAAMEAPRFLGAPEALFAFPAAALESAGRNSIGRSFQPDQSGRASVHAAGRLCVRDYLVFRLDNVRAARGPRPRD